MTDVSSSRVAVIGGGPAGLMAAERLRHAGVAVDLYDAMGSVGRKFLLAGKGGLNLTHGEAFEAFVGRYRERAAVVGDWLRDFDADRLRAWARGLGVETFVGSSGRVFPTDLKAAPLLRRWVRRLHAEGVRFHVHHRWLGWTGDGALRFATADGEKAVPAAATVLALGGGSWPQLGSDAAWVPLLEQAGVAVVPLAAANCGFERTWSEHLVQRCAGAALKAVVAQWSEPDGAIRQRQGECVISAYGLEGSLVYALAPALREQIRRNGEARLCLDLAPGYALDVLAARLTAPRGKHSIGDWLRRRAGLDAPKCALVFEVADRSTLADPVALAPLVKALPLTFHAARPIAEAISTAGGVALESVDGSLMLRDRPGVFCAGEMLDWEAPTGGYLLAACFASGWRAGRAAAAWVTAGSGRSG